MAEGNGDKFVQATPRERSKKYPSDATVTKEYCQNTAEAGASEIHFVFDAPKPSIQRTIQFRSRAPRQMSEVACRLGKIST